MTYKELDALYGGLQKVQHLTGVKFAYAVGKNMDRIEREFNRINKARQPSEDYMEYHEELQELTQKYAVKDDNGNIVEQAKNVPKIDDVESFEKDKEDLMEKHEDAIEKQEKKDKEFNEMLEEEADVELHTVSQDDLPEDITGEQLKNIMTIVDEGA